MAARSALLAPAEAAVDCLGVSLSESVLVVYNDEQKSIADALAAASTPRARNVALLEFPSLSRHGEEPPPEIAEAIAQADVVFAPTSRSISNTQARIEATRRGVRIATLPTITESIFARAVPVDYRELKRTCSRTRRWSARCTSLSARAPASAV